jgi:3-methyladenine DNA glycosylase AlkD
MCIKQLRTELQANVDKEYKVGAQKYFKEEIRLYGVRSPEVKKIAARYFLQIKEKSKLEIYELCEILLKSGLSEEKKIAFNWAKKLSKNYDNSDFKIFESWLGKYVSDWADCDSLCCGAFGEFILKFPENAEKIKLLTKSKNRWFRRGAAVVLIVPNKKGLLLDFAFEIADILLLDKDDLVQKGYGWMLKEISNKHPRRVFEYVMQRRQTMPRTALRYAIEKLTPEQKKLAMQKP